MENSEHQDSVVSFKEWLITIFVAAIPVIGIIMLFIWGFSSNTNRNKANFAKATLILYVFLIVCYPIYIVLYALLVVG